MGMRIVPIILLVLASAGLSGGEIDWIRQGAIITASDSAEKAPYRAGAMQDGKGETAWISGAAQNDHDLDIHWFKRNVSLSGIRLDFTPMEFQYTRDYSYLSRFAGKVPESYAGKSTLPRQLKIEARQYGRWRELGAYPVRNAIFSLRFPQVLHDVQRLRISFETAAGERVAIRELQLPGPPAAAQEALAFVPRLSSGGAAFIWAPDGAKKVPQRGPVTSHFRTPFALVGRKPEAAVLIAAAYNQAQFYLNGRKLVRTPLTVPESKPSALRIDVPVALLEEQNLLSCAADKTDIASGLFGVLYRLAIRYADGSVQYIESNGQTTTASLDVSDGWESRREGFADWKKAHNRFRANGYPGDFWTVDASEPFFADEVELLSWKLTPAIPRDGEAYRLELEFDIPRPLRHSYRVTARYGEMPVELYADYGLGIAISSPDQSLQEGDQGRKRCVISGSWVEEVSPCLAVRLAVSNGQQQAFLRSRVGAMLPAPVQGQLLLQAGAGLPVLPPGFPKAEVKAGRFLVDGKWTAPFFLADNRMTAGRVADQLDHGALQMVRIHQMTVVAPPEYREDVLAQAMRIFEHAARYALGKDPRVKFMLVFNLDPLAEWLFAHPDEQIELGDGSRLMGFYNNRGVGNLQVRASLGSAEYRRVLYDSVYELVARLRKHPFANSVVAVAFDLGLAYENNWGVDRYDFTKGRRNRDSCLAGDFGPAARQALVRFLDRRYATDDDFAKAWKLPVGAKKRELLSLELWPHDRIQKIMLWRDRPRDRFIFRDGRRDGRAAEDLNEFCSTTRAEVLLTAARAVKEASDRRLVVGSYAGYVFPQLVNNPVGSSVYSGHAAAKLLRESPDFDFFSSPQWCHTLDLPVFYSVLTDSPGLYGKAYFAEGDLRTHAVSIGLNFSRREVAMHLRKIAGTMLAKNFGAWFLGWSYGSAGPKGVRFFSDPAVMDELKCLRQAAERPPVQAPAVGNRIALLVSEQSAWFLDLMSPANTVHARLLYQNLHKFLRTGAGCDIMALEDLPRLVKSGRLREYRFVAFYNAFHLNAELRRLINTRVKADGRTVLFFYAPGFHDDDFNRQDTSVSTAGIADLLGVEKVSMLREEHILGAQWNGGEAVDCTIWWDKGQKETFSDKIGPVFYLTPRPGVEALAALRLDGTEHPDKIAAARIQGKEHTVVYVAVPDIPQATLSRLVRESGTLIAADGDVIVNAGNGFLAVSNQEQARRIVVRSAYPADWFELPGDKRVAAGATEVELPFAHYETRLFRLVPRGGGHAVMGKQGERVNGTGF